MSGVCWDYGPGEVDTGLVKLEPNSARIAREQNECLADTSLHSQFNVVGKTQVPELDKSLNGSSTGQSGTCIVDQDKSTVDDSTPCSTSPISSTPICRQFWKAGVYNEEAASTNTRGSSLTSGASLSDIRITRVALGKIKDGTRQEASERHIANQLRYSLRAYLSILYLKLPETFAIVLRGKTVLYHNIASDLKYPEYIMYRTPEGPVVTTIGFIKEAPLVNVHGFNVYHKNRLILPYFPVVSFSRSRGRGVVGILEANFIEPTHDKQDFEKTSIFQKLMYRLKEMTWEYWDYHCGLLGYYIHKKPWPPSATSGASNFVYQHGTEQNVSSKKYSATGGSTRKPPMITTINSKAAFESKSLPEPVEPIISRGFQDEGSNLKKRSSVQPTMLKSEPWIEVDSNKGANLPGLVNSHEAAQVIEENRKLRAQCAEHEKAEEQLKLKVMQLKTELGRAQAEYAHVLAELQDLEK